MCGSTFILENTYTASIMRLVSKHMQKSCSRLVDETTEELIATGADDINDKLRDANEYHCTVQCGSTFLFRMQIMFALFLSRRVISCMLMCLCWPEHQPDGSWLSLTHLGLERPTWTTSLASQRSCSPQALPIST